jgi:predicted Fe-Mo cluster-binding NifX family protein
MRIAISTDQGYVSAHFGRCPSYTIIDIKEGQILNREEIPNPGHQPGFLPQFLSERGVNCIIAGGMGPRNWNRAMTSVITNTESANKVSIMPIIPIMTKPILINMFLPRQSKEKFASARWEKP